MSKSIIVSERDNIAAVTQDGKVVEFFIHRGDMLLGDIYLASVENILPSIDAAFVNLGGDKMGFLHASDVSGKGALKERLTPKQQLLVQIMKEPTGHKGPRVSTSVNFPGRFLVLMPDEKGINISRKITSPKERARLKSIVSLVKPAGVGVIIRTEAENQSEAEIQEDLELLLERWNNVITAADTVTPPNLLYRDQDILYRVIREACTEGVKEIIVDTPFGLHRANQLLQSWNIGHDLTVSVHKGNDSLLVSKGIDREIRTALQTKVGLPCGGYLFIQTTEALTVVDVNSGKFTSSATQSETIRKTNLEAVDEIARQLKLRNIGGMIIIDFIDMENRVDQLAVLEALELALEPDKAKPQVGQLSDLGLVELTRHRQGQSLAEVFTKKCPACSGSGAVIEEFNFALPPQDGEVRLRPQQQQQKVRFPQKVANNNQNKNNNNNKPNNNAQNAANGNIKHQNQQKQGVVNKVDVVEKANDQKKIKTHPSVTASIAQKNKKEEKVDLQVTELNDDLVKKFFQEKGFLPNMSETIVVSAVPAKVAKESLGDRYVPNVFTVLQELEDAEQIIINSQEKPVERVKAEAVKPAITPREDKKNLAARAANVSSEVKLPSVVQIAEENPVIQEASNTPEPRVENVQTVLTGIVPVENKEEQKEKIEKPIDSKPEFSEKIETVKIEESDSESSETEVKKPVKRSSRTSSSTSKSRPRGRSTSSRTKKTAPKPASEE